MNNIRRAIIGTAVVGLSAAGLAVTAAPASAQTVRSHGTVTRAESNRVHRAIDKQRCLTLSETRHIVGAKGKTFKEPEDGTTYVTVTFKGKRGTSVKSLSVSLVDNCAYVVESELTHNRWQYTSNTSFI